MSLTSALNIGRNAIAAQQAAISVTTNNIANAGNTDYTRQSAVITSVGDVRQGNNLVGNGVTLSAINRQIDDALNARLRSANSDSSAADAGQTWTGQIESVFDALGTNGLSSGLSTFFNDWSNVANNPTDTGLRQIVLTDGATLAQTFQDTRSKLVDVRSNIDTTISSNVSNINDLTKQIANLNSQITVAEGGGAGTANDLRDSRDALLKQLSSITNITVRADGSSDNVFIGSQPIVSGTSSRQLTVQTDTTGQTPVAVAFKDDGTAVSITSGSLGGLLASRTEAANAVTKVDSMANSLISELNRLHASGQGLTGISSVTGTTQVSNPSTPLASANLDYPVGNGSFVVTTTQKSTGATTSKLITVTPTTTLNDIASQLGDTNISASVLGGRLQIKSTSSDVTLGFSQDSSGALSALGINTFFSGSNASNIAVNSTLASNPSQLAVSGNGNPGDNSVAVAIAGLDTKSVGSLGNLTLRQSYDNLVTGIGVKTAAAKTLATSASTVLQTLSDQRESLSGVSLDEESVNLMQQQKAFEGAARVISTVNDMLDTLLQLVN